MKTVMKTGITLVTIVFVVVVAGIIYSAKQAANEKECEGAKIAASLDLKRKPEWEKLCYNEYTTQQRGDECMEQYHYSKLRESKNRIQKFCNTSSPISVKVRIRL